jgi:hypothetical protein
MLDGCVCARCGSDQLSLTGSRVKRSVHSSSGYGWLGVGLARCRQCRARERVLPCDLLPGKVHDVEMVFGAVAEVHQGQAIAAVARRRAVSAACVRKWIGGLVQRVLDRVRLYRHRALLVRGAPLEPAVLVRFWIFVGRARPDLTAESLSALFPLGLETPERTRALHALFVVIARSGGVNATARRGAELFSQAVLLFRGVRSDTSSSMVSGSAAGPCWGPWQNHDVVPRPRRSPSGATSRSRRRSLPVCSAKRGGRSCAGSVALPCAGLPG